MPVRLLLLSAKFLLVAFYASAAQPDFGYLGVDFTHSKWPSPESVARDLRSTDDEISSKALALLGAPEPLQQVERDYEAQGYRRTRQVELRYATLGVGHTQQAVIAVTVADVYVYATVAIPEGRGWERIARFDCWCKYDNERVLDAFLQIQGSELVLRASGGGTGLYVQTEAHFRFFSGEMKPVISFVSRRLDYVMPTSQLAAHYEIERRWLIGSRLVEGHASLADPYPSVTSRDLELRSLGRLRCREYPWNLSAFRYEPAGRWSPCPSP